MFLVTWWLIFVFPSISVQAARDGDVRLVGSNRYGTGRVEVFYEGSWGTICHRGWDLDDAEVICRQLNFPHGAQRSFFGARFGEGNGRVLLSDVNCVGEENNLLECDNVQNNWAINDCQHALDVGVQCSAPNYEGCFQISFLRAANGFQSEEMTIETCFGLCASGGYRYFWMHSGESCDCGNSIDATAQVDNEDCATDCPGNSDQRCGGRDLGSVYKVEVDLPYVASPGFPGRFISTGDSLPTSNFDPQGAADYSYVRFHQLDLPTLVNLSVSSNDRTDMFQGGIGINEYWTATANSPIQISFQLAEGNIDSAGFLLEFGEGSYCPMVTSVSNGRLSTTATVPYTVGTQIRVTCNSGFMAYDDTVFCQADGSFNRDIMCVPGGPTTTRSTTTTQSTQQPQQATQNPLSTTQPPTTHQFLPITSNSISVFISVSQKEYTVEEGNTIIVSFTTNEPATEDIDIDVFTLDTSHASELGPLDNAVIRDGESSGALEIQILEDSAFEGRQIVMVSFVSLTSGAGIASGDETISINIIDTTREKNCSVPVIENGEHNSDAAILSPGDELMVTCSFPYKAAENLVTCQRNGDFTASVECVLDLLIIIVIGVSALVFIIIVILLVTLICCLCYYRQKKRRRVSSYERRNEQINLRGPQGGPPPLSRNDHDDDEIFALPEDNDLPTYSESALSAPPSSNSNSPVSPPVHPPPAGPANSPLAPAASSDPPVTPPASTEVGMTEIPSSNSNVPLTGANSEQAAIQSLDNVVNDMERENLYGRVSRPTSAVPGDFGGQFSRV